jgi:hypothetical protein
MNEDDERLFNALNTLRSAAWTSFDKRRIYEWQFCIAIWTALAFFTGTLVAQPVELTKTFPIKGVWPVVFAAIIGLVMTALHAYWIKGAGRANAADRRVSDVYLEKMCPLVQVDYENDLLPIFSYRLDKRGKLSNYSHSVQVAITFILVLSAVCAIWARAM